LPIEYSEKEFRKLKNDHDRSIEYTSSSLKITQTKTRVLSVFTALSRINTHGDFILSNKKENIHTCTKKAKI